MNKNLILRLNKYEFCDFIYHAIAHSYMSNGMVEEVYQKLEMRMGQVGKAGYMGFGEFNIRNKGKMGTKRSNEEMCWLKPKKKNFRKISTQPGVLGSKPIKEPSQCFQGPAQHHGITRGPAKQNSQVGESSSTGAERRTGESGMPIAGDIAGEHFADAGVPFLTTVEMISESENDGVSIGGLGREEEEPAQRLGSIPEVAEELGSPLSTPVRCSKVTESWRTIPETVAMLGDVISPPVKSSNRVLEMSENAGERVKVKGTARERVRECQRMPAKQVKVFQGRESPSKPTKSWVAERVSWNGSRGCDMTTIDSSGKSVAEEQFDQGLGSDSPVSRDLNMAWKVKGPAGLSWDGQIGKLKQVFGQIVASKYEEGTSSSLGEEVDGFKGMRDDDIPYEA
jgi:hypothetical protein